MKKMSYKGFTLAELLIALAILGVIATFTIPKILNNATSGQNTAIAKEAASTISGAFSGYMLDNTIDANTNTSAIIGLINYVRITTISSGGTNAINCTTGGGRLCMVLHSGAYIGMVTTQSYNTVGTNSSYLTYNIDPDGTGTAVGAGSVVIYSNGRFTTGGNATGTAGTGGITLVTLDPSFLTF